MSSKLVLSLDLGTTGVRAILYTSQGKISSTAYLGFKQYYPQPGLVEHDAEEIYRSLAQAIKLALKKSRTNPKSIISIGITNQRETVVLWNKVTGKPVCKAIVWQDRRTQDFCQKLKSKGHEKTIRAKTGLVLDPYFSATKINWILKNISGAKQLLRKKQLLAGTIDSWILWKLTGEHATEYTNASRTLLFNIHKKIWDKDLLKLFSVPESILPTVKPSSAFFGKTNVAYLPKGIPVEAILGDQQAALYGHGCYKRGDVKNTYGTGCFMVMNVGSKKPRAVDGLLLTLASDEAGKPVYAYEGSIFIAGAVVQWLRDELKMIKRAEETESLCASVNDTHGMTIIPAFAGLGSPYWRSDIRGSISGLTRGVSKAHFVRAAMESIAHQSADVLVLMKKVCKAPIKTFKTDGKAALNRFLMQFQSDITGLTVESSDEAEVTAWGVAKLAGKRHDFWVARLKSSSGLKYKRYTPTLSAKARSQSREKWYDEMGFALSKK